MSFNPFAYAMLLLLQPAVYAFTLTLTSRAMDRYVIEMTIHRPLDLVTTLLLFNITMS
jgi:hypothetical protein